MSEKKFIDIHNSSSDKNSVDLYYRLDGRKIMETHPVEWYFVIKRSDYNICRSKILKLSQYLDKVRLSKKWAKIYCSKYKIKVIDLFKSFNIPLYESDLSNSRRFWIDNAAKNNWKIADATDYKTIYYDIETDDTTYGLEIGKSPILSFAAKDSDGREYFYSIKKCGSERKLLEKFKKVVELYDIMIGWNSFNFDLPYIKDRMKRLGMNYYIRTPHIDMQQRMMHAYRWEAAMKGFSLEYVSNRFLGEGKIKHKEKIIELYNDNYELFEKYNRRDVELLYLLEKETKLLFTLYKQANWCNTFIRNIGQKGKGLYVMLDNVILTIAHEHNEYGPSPVLSHDEWIEIYEKHAEDLKRIKAKCKELGVDFKKGTVTKWFGKESRPDLSKVDWSEWPELEELRKEYQHIHDSYFYEGGFVANPLIGRYDTVYSFDYKSLYPTTIVSGNIGFETLRDKINEKDKDKYIVNPAGTYFKKDPQSILSIVIEMLMEKRKEYKKKLLDIVEKGGTGSVEYQNMHSSEIVVKELSNSCYGIMGNRTGRYYSVGSKIPKSVTLMGQQMIHYGMEFAEYRGEKMNSEYKVIYGDSVTNDSCVPVKINDSTFVIRMDELYERFSKEQSPIYTLTKEGNWKKILRVIRHTTDKKIYDVIQPHGFVSVTPDHSFYADNTLHSALDFKKQAEYKNELKLDTIKTKLNFTDTLKEINISPNCTIKIDSDLATILGAYISEGSVTINKNKYTNCRLVCGDDIVFIDTVYKSAITIFGEKNVNKRLYKRGGYVSVSNNTNFATIIQQWCGYSSEHKQLPDWILQTNKNFFEQLLQSYQKGDGVKKLLCDDFSKGCAGGKSRKLVSQLWFILSSCYDNYYLKFKYFGPTKTNTERCCYGIYWTDLNRASNRVRGCIDRKYRCQSYRKERTKTTDGYVYDIEVEDDHTFIECIGMVPMHNTDSLMVSTEEKIDPDEYLKDYHEWLSKKLKDNHNISEHIYELEFDRLYVPYILLNKKTYTGRVINQEHKKVDTIYNRGLELVKSSTCLLAAKLQKELIELLLKTNNDLDFYKQWIENKREHCFDDVQPEDIMLGQKINKNVDSYKNKPLAAIIAERKMQKEGGLSSNRIEYIITGKNDGKLDGVELSEFDGTFYKEHYWNNILLSPCTRLLKVVYKEVDWDSKYKIETPEEKERRLKKEEMAKIREENKRLREQKKLEREKEREQKKLKRVNTQLKLIDC